VIRKKQLCAVAGAAALAASLAACGGTPPKSDQSSGPVTVDFSTGDPAADTSKEWTLGTTDAITALDPAGAYDVGSWNLQYEMFQQLMMVPANQTDPQPDAAKSCTYTDPKTVKCVLNAGLTFSNGDPLTSSDVKYSFERNIAINDPNGAAILLGAITDSSNADHPKLAKGAIDTPDDTTIVFHLNAPDQTFMKVLATPPASIVDEDVYPATKELPDSQPQIGSGPYTLTQYKDGQQAVFVKNAKYHGSHPGLAPKIFVSFYKDDSSLTSDMQSGAVDVAWRSMSPTELQTLAKAGTSVLQGKGSEFRYWVFDMNEGVGKQAPVRQAVANIIDRDAIAADAYDGTVKPSYSIVPPGFGGQKDSFKSAYPKPDVAKAKQILSDAGIKTPIPIKLAYPQEHYGPNAVDEANELAQQLNDSGLFKATTATGEWEQYQTDYKKDAYDLYLLGWYPDFLDADNYLTPFVKDGGFFANGYHSDAVDKLLAQEVAETNQSKRDQEIGQLQDLVAKDVPLIPSWNGLNVAVAGPGMGGVQSTLDPTYIFRFWMITKS